MSHPLRYRRAGDWGEPYIDFSVVVHAARQSSSQGTGSHMREGCLLPTGSCARGHVDQGWSLREEVFRARVLRIRRLWDGRSGASHWASSLSGQEAPLAHRPSSPTCQSSRQHRPTVLLERSEMRDRQSSGGRRRRSLKCPGVRLLGLQVQVPSPVLRRRGTRDGNGDADGSTCHARIRLSEDHPAAWLPGERRMGIGFYRH